MMPLQDLIVAIVMTIFLIVGVYQFYFLISRLPLQTRRNMVF